MNDNKTADEFREEELFRKFLEKHKSESSGGDVDWWALSTDDSKEPETADDSAQKSGEYPDFDLDEASAQAYGEDEGAPDNEEWHSEYEGDKIIEKFADVLFVCNELNAQYKWVTFYLAKDNSIVLHDDAILSIESAADEAFELLVRILKIGDEVKPRLMKAIYA